MDISHATERRSRQDFIASAVKSMIYARKNHNRGERLLGKLCSTTTSTLIHDRFFPEIRKLNLLLKSVYGFFFRQHTHCNYTLKKFSCAPIKVSAFILQQEAELINAPQQFYFTFTFQSPNERQTNRKWPLGGNYCNHMFLTERITRGAYLFQTFIAAKHRRPPNAF